MIKIAERGLGPGPSDLHFLVDHLVLGVYNILGGGGGRTCVREVYLLRLRGASFIVVVMRKGVRTGFLDVFIQHVRTCSLEKGPAVVCRLGSPVRLRTRIKVLTNLCN